MLTKQVLTSLRYDSLVYGTITLNVADVSRGFEKIVLLR